jgi:L-fucose mutarotase/ribose pyranase (RbsD/FucU family)
VNYQFDPFEYYYEKIDWPIYNFQTECVMAAKKAASMNKKNLPIIILMSGGMDSEIIGEGFYRAGISFKVLIGKLQVEVATETLTLNEHDYCYAEKWCKARNIEVEYCCMDVYQNSKLLTEYAMSSKGFSPQYAWHMYLMKYANDKGYFFVAGLGDIDIVLKDGEYYCADTQREWSIDIFCENHNIIDGIDGIIRFVKLDSRLTASFLQMNSVKRLMSEKVEELLKHKYEYFLEAFPEMENRCKCTGFEYIQEWDNILRTYMKKFHAKYNTISYIPIAFFRDDSTK